MIDDYVTQKEVKAPQEVIKMLAQSDDVSIDKCRKSCFFSLPCSARVVVKKKQINAQNFYAQKDESSQWFTTRPKKKF